MSTLTKANTTGDHFLLLFERLEKELSAGDAPWLRRLRNAAIARYAELGLPGARNEDWKFTSVAPIAHERFVPAMAPTGFRPDSARLTGTCDVVFQNGQLAQEPTVALPQGVVVASLAHVLRSRPHLLEGVLGRVARFDDHAFTALNTAFLGDGAVIFVPRGTALVQPIHVVHQQVCSATEAALIQPRTVVILEENSQATLIESFEGSRGERYFTNAVAEVELAQGAMLDHYKVQNESTRAFHVANTAVRLGGQSRFRTHYFGLGGELFRNEVRVLFTGERAEATVNGLYLATDRQHADNHTVIDHAVPHCASHELYKGILNGQAKGVFNGKIFVRQDAQKTDAKQTNQTLLLSDDATINTKPQLEIFADDVKCTHGATVGQLDEEALFYLRSRGLDLAAARNLLIFAFANDVVSRIEVPALRGQLEAVLLRREEAS